MAAGGGAPRGSGGGALRGPRPRARRLRSALRGLWPQASEGLGASGVCGPGGENGAAAAGRGGCGEESSVGISFSPHAPASGPRAGPCGEESFVSTSFSPTPRADRGECGSGVPVSAGRHTHRSRDCHRTDLGAADARQNLTRGPSERRAGGPSGGRASGGRPSERRAGGPSGGPGGADGQPSELAPSDRLPAATVADLPTGPATKTDRHNPGASRRLRPTARPRPRRPGLARPTGRRQPTRAGAAGRPRGR